MRRDTSPLQHGSADWDCANGEDGGKLTTAGRFKSHSSLGHSSGFRTPAARWKWSRTEKLGGSRAHTCPACFPHNVTFHLNKGLKKGKHGMEETGPRGGSTGEPQGFSSVPGFENKPEQKSGEHGRHPQAEEWGRWRGCQNGADGLLGSVGAFGKVIGRYVPDALEHLERVSDKVHKKLGKC